MSSVLDEIKRCAVLVDDLFDALDAADKVAAEIATLEWHGKSSPRSEGTAEEAA